MLFRTKDLEFDNFLRYDDLEILEDKVTFIIGKSGGGKTTLFRLFNNTLSPSRGKVFYRGNNVANMEPLDIRRRILLASQEVFLFEGTIRDNFDKFAQFRQIPPFDNREVIDALKTCNVRFDINQNIVDFSGGERQRLYLGILSLMPFETILLDEPTSAMDHATSLSVLENFIEFCKQKGKQIMMISHSQQLEAKFSQQTIVI